MRKKLLLGGVFLFCCFLQTMAQQRTVTGKVTSSDGSPLVGATVIVVGQKSGETTDANGAFSISVPQNAKQLQISYVGYQSETVDISGQTDVKVTLQSSAQALTDVVVTGYGTTR